MQSHGHVAAPPSKPMLVFDGDCNFCKLWVGRWQSLTGDAVDYVPAQDPVVAERFPEIPRARFEEAVQLILPDGTVCSGAEAVFRTLAYQPRWRWLLRIYEKVPWFAGASEAAYHIVATHRTFFSRLTRWCWGRHLEPPGQQLVRWLFLRALGVVYLLAFVSLWTQITGLVGHNGILPTDQFMSEVRQQTDARGIGLERYYLLPTLCWFDSSDAFLQFQCGAGAVLAALLIAGIAPVPSLALLWLFYLSLMTIGRDFLGFQWDGLLLETGFLAIFFAPWGWLSRPGRDAPPGRTVLWLLRLLLFKLMFLSGGVKLLSQDPNWRNLTALTFHYQTQPLPPWTAWYANQLPFWFQKMSCIGLFAIELGAPWLIFAPRRLRFAGCAGMAGLQILILLTGNYAFFNCLTLALCLLLLDDAALTRYMPTKLAGCFSAGSRPVRSGWPRPVVAGLVLVVFPASFFQLTVTLGLRSPLLAPAGWEAGMLSPLRTVNSYGLFAVMTTKRGEIILEGSNDGLNWTPYDFKYKPGDSKRRPGFIAPFQPRLDWQMWFAALGNYQDNPWLVRCCERLLEGSPEVLALLAKNPFPGHPPRYVRAEFYDYRLTTFAERAANGAWWKREWTGEYMPPVSLR